jgi:hypothetical protein
MLIIHAMRMLWPEIEKGAKVPRYFRVMLGKGSAYAVKCFAGNFIGVDFDLDIDLADKLPEDWREFNKTFGGAVGLVDFYNLDRVSREGSTNDKALSSEISR